MIIYAGDLMLMGLWQCRRKNLKGMLMKRKWGLRMSLKRNDVSKKSRMVYVGSVIQYGVVIWTGRENVCWLSHAKIEMVMWMCAASLKTDLVGWSTCVKSSEVGWNKKCFSQEWRAGMQIGFEYGEEMMRVVDHHHMSEWNSKKEASGCGHLERTQGPGPG